MVEQIRTLNWNYYAETKMPYDFFGGEFWHRCNSDQFDTLENAIAVTDEDYPDCPVRIRNRDTNAVVFERGAKTECEHKHTELSATGGMTFSGGVVDDDLEFTLVCVDCGAVIPEVETTPDNSPADF